MKDKLIIIMLILMIGWVEGNHKFNCAEFRGNIKIDPQVSLGKHSVCT